MLAALGVPSPPVTLTLYTHIDVQIVVFFSFFLFSAHPTGVGYPVILSLRGDLASLLLPHDLDGAAKM